ncbi:RHS repeat-associated core domain-containing protein [Crocosphaera watsonii]|uniref:Rhs family protein n=1 Tax=Crocosphaera watsonii WH 0003 TaxID=423471 RepID=G5JDZ0_CROWT|nr:RHS repeat-associated core domain-containing protein [Crocosphaera watsonii]EHJ09603.1 Rhs family protein [Crocosphaera watsonii WH 0003]
MQWQPQSDQLGQFDIAVAAIDSDGAGTVQAFSISIQPQNQPPVITSTTPPTVATTQTVYRYDLHVRELDGEKLTYSLVQGPSGMTIDELGRVRWTPNAKNTGNYPIEIAVTDSLGATVTQSFTLEVVADTLAPMVRVNPSVQPVNLGQSVTLYVRATDNIGVSTLSLTVNGQAVSLDGNGLYTFTPDTVGTIEAIATATDAAGNSQSAITTFEVLDFSDEDAPIINLPAFSEDTITNPTEIIGTVNDDNLQYYSLEVAKLGSDDFQEVFRGTNEVNNDVLGIFDPTLLENDAYSLRLKAVDAGGNVVFEQRTINVEGDLKLGNFQLSFTDLSIPVSGIPISITRTYDTLTAQERDDFGYGWRLEFRDTNLRTSLGPDDYYDTFDIIGKGFREGDKVYITLPGGKRETFTFKPELDLLGAFLAAAGGGLGIQEDTGLYHPKFVSESDSNNVLTVKDALLIRTGTGEFAGIPANLYNPIDPYFGRKYTLTTGEGIVYEIDALSGDLLTATDTNGNKLTFSESGIISDSGVEVKFNRDAKGRITSIVDPSGNIIQYEYDGNGDLIKVIDREENETKFDYHEQRDHYLETIIDPLNREAVRTEYDEDGRLSRVIDINGEAVELVYDPDNSTQTTKDVFGNETTYVYDERGNILTEVDPVGKVTKRTYDENGNVLSETIITEETGEEGWTTAYTYDDRSNKLSETDALGNTTRYTYGKYDRLLSETDALGNTTIYKYDSRGNLIFSEDALNNTKTYSYDENGNLASITEVPNRVRNFKYDGLGNLISEIDALGNEKNYTYDENGNVLTETTVLTTNEGVRNLTSTKTYNEQGLVSSLLDAEGNLTQYEYDANGNQTAIIDALGQRIEYRYDEKNQLIETIYPDETPENDTDNLRIETSYDKAGNKLSFTDVAGRNTLFEYDSLGNVTEVIYSDDTPDNLSDNPRVVNEYNQLGQIVASTDQLGVRTEYEYDKVGRVIVTRQLSGNQVIETHNTYDVIGQKISTTDALKRTTRYVYDALGRVTETIFHDGTSIKTEYDAFGNEITKTDQAGVTTYYKYDALDRLTAVVNALGQRTEYQYDEAGNLVYQKDANDHITRFEFDGIGRQTAVIRPLGQESLTLYNEVGNVISTTDFNGEIIHYEHNQFDQLTAKRFENGTSVEFSYNEAGQLATITDSRGTTSFTYDVQGNSLSRTEPDGKSISYTYNDSGKLESVITDSVTTSYTYDQFNFLDKVTANGEVTDYDYNVLGNLVQTTLPNGVVETREYDELYRLIGVDNTDADGNILSSYDYELDAVGNRTLVEELSGRTVAYEYDKLYRLLTEDVSDAVNGNQTLSYVYDAVGNRLSLTDSVNGVTTYSYNDNDWLLSETIGGVTTKYTYDNNGNNLTKINPDEQVTYTWNQENRLIGAKVTNADGTTNLGYQYDANGVRVASTVNGVETRYLVDANREHAEVIEEYNPDGTTNVSYVYGLNLISAERGGEQSYYVHDGHSGVRQLTDDNGNVTDSYDYDGYGNLLNSTGDTQNNYLYRGEQYDPNLAMQYLRQRYYDTSVGRFASVDPFSGLIELPMSRHRYLYGNANPITYTDPSGEFSVAELSLQGVLSSLSYATTGLKLAAIAESVAGAAAALSVAYAGYNYWRGRGGGVVWDGNFTLTKLPNYGIGSVASSIPTIAIGKAGLTSNRNEFAPVSALGGIYTLSDGFSSPISLPSTAKFDVTLRTPDVARAMQTPTAANRGAFIGPFIFSSLKFSFALLLPEDVWAFNNQTFGVLQLGLGIGTVAKTKPVGDGSLADGLTYDPFALSVAVGASSLTG